MIHFRVLGTLGLRNPAGGDIPAVLAQPKRVALLAYLALARPRGFQRRDTLLALLWPELDDQHARWALNQALRHLRTALGKEALPSRGDGEVGIDASAIACDAVAFDAAIEAGDFAQAVELYRGDLLEGFHVSGGDEFERWLESERTWLRRRAAGAAVSLALAEEARGETLAAGHWARRALAIVPDDEGEFRRVLELMGRLGDRAGAVQAYEAFARRLRVEFDVEPAPETRAAIAAIRARQAATVPTPSAAGTPESVATRPSTNAQPTPSAADAPESVTTSPTPDSAPTSELPPTRDASAAPPANTPAPLHTSAPARRGTKRAGLIALLACGVLALGGMVVRGAIRPERAAPATAVAVLPFANLGPDGTDEYFADGIADEIMSALGRVEGLRVAARTSAFALKGKRERPGEIGRLLGVGTVVDGSVRREGTRLRVSVQLVDVADGYQRWAETYDREARDIFAVQEEIAQEIVRALRLELGTPTRPIVAQLTTDLVAYDFFLKGRHAVRQRSGDAMLQAVAHFEQALARDSGFAQAHAGLATAYALLPGYAVRSSAESWPRARVAAERALRLDSTLVEALTTLAYGTYMFEADWPASERLFRRAIATDPGSAEAHHWYGDVLGGRGDLDGYLREVRVAHALDPISRQIATEVARALWALRRHDEAIAQLEPILRVDSTFAEAHVTLGRVRLQQGRLAEAVAAFRRAVDLRGRDALDVADLAYACAVSGRRDEAAQLLAELQTRARTAYVPPTAFAIIHMALGDEAQAFDWLERAAAEHDGWLAESIFYPTFNPLRSHPRYAGILARLGLG